MRPFQQIPFGELPEEPRIPHAWERVSHHREPVTTDSFGTLDTAWATFGAGPPLLLIHGLMTHGWSFRYVLEPLGRHYQLVIPDLPGAGASGKPDRSYHPDRLAEWIGEFAGHVGIRGAHCLGNSLGGYLCMRLALRDSGAVGRLVNLHSPGIPNLRLYALHAAMRTPGAHALLGRLIRWDPERWCHYNTHYYDETLKSKREARIWAEPLRSRDGAAAFARILRETLDVSEMRRFVRQLTGLRDGGEPFPVPLLLVYAESDPMVPPSVGRALGALIPGAEQRWLQSASHFAHVDAVEPFVSAISPFLAQGEPCV